MKYIVYRTQTVAENVSAEYNFKEVKDNRQDNFNTENQNHPTVSARLPAEL